MTANNSSTGVLVPLHPEAVDGDSDQLRWVLPAGTFAFVGAVIHAPHLVQQLIDDGTLADLTIEPTAIRTRLGVGRSWRIEGKRVRAALQSAAATPEQWIPGEDSASDAVLTMAVQQVIEGEVGDYVRSHGGSVELLNVDDGTVEVRLDGACAHCPASEVTLTTRFEKAVRASYPAVKKITAVTGRHASEENTRAGRRWFSLTPR